MADRVLSSPVAYWGPPGAPADNPLDGHVEFLHHGPFLHHEHIVDILQALPMGEGEILARGDYSLRLLGQDDSTVKHFYWERMELIYVPKPTKVGWDRSKPGIGAIKGYVPSSLEERLGKWGLIVEYRFVSHTDPEVLEVPE